MIATMDAWDSDHDGTAAAPIGAVWYAPAFVNGEAGPACMESPVAAARRRRIEFVGRLMRTRRWRQARRPARLAAQHHPPATIKPKIYTRKPMRRVPMQPEMEIQR